LCRTQNLFVAIGTKYSPLVPGKSKEDSVLNTILLFDNEERIKSINSIEIKANSRFCNLFDADTQVTVGGTPIMFAVPGCGIDGIYVVELNRLNFSVIKPLQEGWITSLFVDAKSQRVYTTSNDGTLSIVDIDPVTPPPENEPQISGVASAMAGAGNNKPAQVSTSTGKPSGIPEPASKVQSGPTGQAKPPQSGPIQPSGSQPSNGKPIPTTTTTNPTTTSKQPLAQDPQDPADF